MLKAEREDSAHMIDWGQHSLYLLQQESSYSIGVSILACHVRDPGSIPGNCAF